MLSVDVLRTLQHESVYLSTKLHLAFPSLPDCISFIVYKITGASSTKTRTSKACFFYYRVSILEFSDFSLKVYSTYNEPYFLYYYLLALHFTPNHMAFSLAHNSLLMTFEEHQCFISDSRYSVGLVSALFRPCLIL